MIAPETALVICRFVFDGAVIFLWGTAAYLAAAVPPLLAAQVAARLAFPQYAAAVLALLAVAALLPSEAAMIGDGWPSVDLSLIGDVLFGTGVGFAWLAQAVGGLCLVFIAYRLPAKDPSPTPPHKGERLNLLHRHGSDLGETQPQVSSPLVGEMAGRPEGVLTGGPLSSGFQAALAVISALLLATLSIAGHAAMEDGWLGVAHRANHILHLLSGGAWLGALVPVLMILPRLGEPEARLALMRFSTLGHAAVALVILTGLLNTLLIVGRLPLDWSFPYQVLLSAKMALAAAMTLLAIVNRYAFVPRLARDRDHATRALMRGTVAEIVLGAFILALVAWFGTLDPQ